VPGLPPGHRGCHHRDVTKRNPSHRVAEVELTLLDPDGLPLANAPVTVAQRDHAFRFGCTGFEAVGFASGELDEDTERRAATAGLLARSPSAAIPTRTACVTPPAGSPSAGSP
jgi:hypothetical protein